MGQGKELKCKECGNVWTHYMGVGCEMIPICGSKEKNITGDVDGIIKCPVCDSISYEDASDGIIFMWD